MELCIALDLPTRSENLELVEKLSKFKGLWYKVGLRSYLRDGKKLIRDIKFINEECNIFLDLKLHDIPNTMISSVDEIVKLGVDMFTVHISAGEQALTACSQVLGDYSNEVRPSMIGVTALTSLSDKDCLNLFGKRSHEVVKKLATIAYNSKLDGVVCSVWHIESIRQQLNSLQKGVIPYFDFVCPGIRQNGINDRNDHAQHATVSDAKILLADMIVIGRPIYQSKNPEQAVESVLGQMACPLYFT